MFKQTSELFILFIIYSFLGWLMEVILTIVKQHKVVNRGFLIGPYCPIYGWGCLFIIISLDRYKDSLFILFVMSVVICSILEYVTSYVMEKKFNARWWDYSNNKFNINGRICLETMIPFGILGTIVICVINPFFVSILNKCPSLILEIVAVIIFIIFIIDNIISSSIIVSFKNEVSKIEKDRTEEITKKVREVIMHKGYLHKRLINAFPSLTTYRDRLVKIRNKINKDIENFNNLKNK